MKEQLELYREVHRLLIAQDYNKVSDILHDTIPDAELTMGLLRLTFTWRHQIPRWADAVKITADKIDKPELMRGLIESIQNN